MPKILYVVYALLRIIFQMIQLTFIFLSEHYDYIIMQNPPCVPLLLVLVLLKVTGLNRSELIIDWHNYGYSIMRVNNVNKVLVFIAKLYEMKLAKWGDHHLCVSKAMQIDLINKFGLSLKGSTAKSPPHVLYDKATQKFKQTLSLRDTHALYLRAGLKDQKCDSNTLFTELDKKTDKI